MKWPATIDEVEAAGYVYMSEKREPCSCGEKISWFLTVNGAWIPFSLARDGVRIMPHHAVCDRIKEFRKANKRHAQRAEGPQPKQGNLFEGE